MVSSVGWFRPPVAEAVMIQPADCELRVSAQPQNCEDFVKPVGALAENLL
jgi:hypothetical protein